MQTVRYQRVASVEVMLPDGMTANIFVPAEETLTVSVTEGGFAKVGPVKKPSGDAVQFVLYIPPTKEFRLRGRESGSQIIAVD